MFAATFAKVGGPEVFTYGKVPLPVIKPGHVLIRNRRAGLNYIDVYHRTGAYPVPSFPAIIGREGCGSVIKVADDVSDLAVGDRVAYVLCPSYAQVVCVPRHRIVKLDGGEKESKNSNDSDSNEAKLTDDTATAAMVQGLTAHYLVRSTFRVNRDSCVLVHAGAGGMGQLLLKMCKKVLGAKLVIATASTDAKAEIARGCGADHVFTYENFVEKTKELLADMSKNSENSENSNDLNGLDVVYDGVGRTTFLRGLDVLKPLGMMVNFGSASGAPEPLTVGVLAKKGSLFVTRPSLAHYIPDQKSLEERANELFTWVAEGKLSFDIGALVELKDVAKAHENLQARKTTGKTLFSFPDHLPQ